MESNYFYNNNAVTETDVNYNRDEEGNNRAPPIIMDIDDYNNELARRVKKPLDKKLKTYIPFSKTFEVYANKRIPYAMPEGEKRVTNFVIESGETYSRKVTRIYKIKSPHNDNKIFIMWNEIRYGRTGIGNTRTVTADNVGQYMEPIPDYGIGYDQRTEAQAVRIKGTKEVVTRYNLEYNPELVAELIKDAEGSIPDTVEFVLKVDGKQEDMIVSYTEFINPDFDAVYQHHRNMITAMKTGLRTGPATTPTTAFPTNQQDTAAKSTTK